MITPLLEAKPSISTSKALSVCSRSSCAPSMLLPRILPSESNSSMNTMHGALAWACLNMSRTRAAPTPANISTKSEPERLKNGTPASPAIALAKQRFAGARRTDQKHALGNPAAENLVFFRRFEKIDYFAQFSHCFVDAGNVVKSDADDLSGRKACPGCG